MAENNGVPIVGFDLGHGETALAITYAGKTAPPAVLDLPGASGAGRQHVTAVNEHPDKGIIVGEAAVEARGGTLHLGFKGRALERDQVRRPVELFSTKIREDLVSQGKLPNPASRIRWVFGTPSGWPPRLREAYATLFRQAGFSHVEVVPESRAALLYARDSGEVPLEARQLGGCVLVVDLGSSTTDFTSIVERKDRPIDQGTELGASLIDRAIRDRVLATHPQSEQLGDAIQKDRSLRLRLEMLCRRAKEDFFRLAREVASAPDASVIRTARVETTRGVIYVNVELTAADVQAILDTPLGELGGRSWRQAFHDDLAAAGQTLGTEPDAVLLTGGASRMHFVLDVARDRFGADRVLIGTEPEAAIARGLAIAGRINMHAAGFMADVAELVDGNQIEALVTERLPEFARMMGAAAADGITKRHVIPAFRRWRNGEIGTLDQVADTIAKGVEAELNDPANTAITRAFVTWYNKLQPELEELTRPICVRWHLPPAAMALPKVDFSGRTYRLPVADTGAATQMLEGLAHVANVVVAGIIATTLFGAGVAIIASTGPFAVIIAAVAAWWAMKEGMDAAKEKARSYVIPLGVRQLRSERGLLGKLERDAATTERTLAEALANQFLTDGGPDLVADISKSIANQLGALADDAKLLIS